MKKLAKSNSLSCRKPDSQTALDLYIVRPVKPKNYDFARPDVVKAGSYSSRIVGVEASITKTGKDAVDILYRLINSNGVVHHVRMRYPVNSHHYETLCNALLNAGIPENSSISSAVGIEEQVYIDYTYGNDIGTITDRRPLKSNPAFYSDAEDESDFLIDDDD